METENFPNEIESLRELASRLILSTNALVALGITMNQRITGNEKDSAIKPYLDEVVNALGVRSAIENVNPSQLRTMLAEIYLTIFQGANVLSIGPQTASWSYTEPNILRFAGEVSASFPQNLKQRIVPKLAGLAERLESNDARFLDIGVGVAAMAIEMARLWPSLRITGIEPWHLSLTLARENVRNAGLEDRIELREQKGEEITDKNFFDLAWIPSAFISCSSVSQLLIRIHEALRSGGWAILAMVRPGNDPLTSALVRLRTAQWGGCLMSASDAEETLKKAGFTEVHSLPTPPNALIAMTVGRKSPNLS